MGRNLMQVNVRETACDQPLRHDVVNQSLSSWLGFGIAPDEILGEWNAERTDRRLTGHLVMSVFDASYDTFNARATGGFNAYNCGRLLNAITHRVIQVYSPKALAKLLKAQTNYHLHAAIRPPDYYSLNRGKRFSPLCSLFNQHWGITEWFFEASRAAYQMDVTALSSDAVEQSVLDVFREEQ